MEMRVGIVDDDIFFVKRFCESMNQKFSDLEVFHFPTLEQAQTAAENNVLHLLLVDGSIMSKSLNSLIPLQCKVAVLTSEKATVEDGSLPCICKYQSVDEWHVLICNLCSVSETFLDNMGGEEGLKSQNKTCLFVPGGISSSGASNAASKFCHFLFEEGFNSAVIEPFFESGEALWRMVEAARKTMTVTAVCLSEFNDDSIVIPFINADAVIYVSNGTAVENKNIELLIHKMPELTRMSLEETCEKSYLLYNDFCFETGVIFRNNQIGRLGGLDNEKNSTAAFEKLVTVLGV